MKEPCGATMESLMLDNHTHACTGTHDEGHHMCSECRRYFGKADN